jgi:hypothetical protein
MEVKQLWSFSMAMAWMERIDLDEDGRLAEAVAKVREGLEAAWTERSLKDAEAWLADKLAERPWLGYEVREGSEYLMEGECGQWSFTTHEVVDGETGRVLYSTRRRMPELRGEARCRTGAFKSIAVFLGAKDGLLQACRRTPLSSLEAKRGQGFSDHFARHVGA